MSTASDTQHHVRAFFGEDPVAGDDALQFFTALPTERALESLLPLEQPAGEPSPQVEIRLRKLAAGLGSNCTEHLLRVVKDGVWRSKLNATPCFAGLPDPSRAHAELFELAQAGSFDVQWMAIEALGYLGATSVAALFVTISTGGALCVALRETDRDVLARLYRPTLQALIRSTERESDPDTLRSCLGLVPEFVAICEANLPGNRVSDWDIRFVLHHLNPRAADPIRMKWIGSEHPRPRRMGLEALGNLRLERMTPALLDVLFDPAEDAETRRAAGAALSQYASGRAAERLAARLRGIAPAEVPGLDLAFSALYGLWDAWPKMDEYAADLAAKSSEPACQMLYSLAFRGKGQATPLTRRLDDKDPFTRWSAALALARLLGAEALPYIGKRDREASTSMEEAFILAAQIHAGAEGKADALHAAMQRFDHLQLLRPIWKREILYALFVAEGGDSRRARLWCEAAQAQPEQILDEISTRVGLSESHATEAEDDDAPVAQVSGQTNSVFVSYSRRDREWLARFQKTLAPVVRSGTLDLWDDTRTEPGKWRPQIDDAMKSARIALFLVSTNFLESEFVMNHELPTLLQAAVERNVTILWVLLDAALYEETEIADYQCSHDPKVPLSSLEPPAQQQAIADACRQILRAIRDD